MLINNLFIDTQIHVSINIKKVSSYENYVVYLGVYTLEIIYAEKPLKYLLF